MALLIADSGSTKTDWRLVDTDGQTHAIQTDGLNPYYQSTAQMTETLREQLVPQVADATVRKVFFYGTGCTGPAVNHIVADSVQAILPGLQVVEVNSDMLGAARGATGHEPGIVCILGTGSNACCYDGEKISRSIQSLGFWLGDEGSGGYLGKTLVRDFFQERLPADLREQFQERYGLDRPTLLENAYQKPYPNRYFAAFTPFLSERLTHPYIKGLVTDAFTLFLTTYVKRFPESGQWPVHFVGSIAHYFAQPLQIAIQQTGLIMGTILKAPVERLVEFHKNS
ncbi:MULTISPECIES: N-acetylglucosamine kinase [unclassified Spirosoma]|uniref:N-acetylglucosamine kinase n=1 Tax=unclassified Spirosoma TaxID=2621999 RepID=UPI000963E2E0|nr:MULTISPECIES: N-acetylglucosamine kinase [unclassified Spirosoma]MBN8825919.1 N-acetylglucosamine kinase [Spirosoma sp.]OJW70603.1 MAG: N-acetylglucosamine kinase [Spirosoma sp. 48-14]